MKNCLRNDTPNPKLEIRKKPECRSPKQEKDGRRVEVSGFGFRIYSDFEIRISDLTSELLVIGERLFLIGYRGTGKSTVARWLAERLGWDWIDADDFLEKTHETTIRAIFEREGEAGFRAKEANVLAELCQRPRCVIATGGGVVLGDENRKLLRQSGRVVWLRVDARAIHHRLQADATSAERRPPLTDLPDLKEIESLLALREPLYRACADLTIDASRLSPEDVVKHIGIWLDHAQHD